MQSLFWACFLGFLVFMVGLLFLVYQFSLAFGYEGWVLLALCTFVLMNISNVKTFFKYLRGKMRL